MDRVRGAGGVDIGMRRATYTSSVTFEQQNTLYENVGEGSFRDVSDAAGPALADRQVSRGLAAGDLDGDGDLDFVVSNNGGTAQVGLNATPRPGGFVGLWLGIQSCIE